MLFDHWIDLVHVVVAGILAYGALVAVLRLSSKRTLAKLNAFDLVVTVALGSTLATILLSKDVSLAEGVLAFLVLVLLQFGVAWSSIRSATVERLAKSSPRLLLEDGQMRSKALREERVTRDEVLAAIRSAGLGDTAAIAAVVLETDGSLSVIAQAKAGGRTAWPQEPGT